MTTRAREATMIVSIVATLVAVLVITGLLIRQGGASSAGVGVPLALSNQPAPVQVGVRGAPATVGRSVLQASPTWVSQTAASSGLPATAVAAYGDATLAIQRTDPSCHLGWTTLAGIGTIESANGTIGGRQLLPSGLSTTPISGPALNGAGGYAAIGNGSGGWSSALGPMQFIVSTWQRWGADGNGDGVIDINNIYDAALTAGRYLCADGRDLATAQGWTAAIFSYNHSAPYVQEVYTAANAAAA